jgi:hypothetical protein
MRAQKKKKNGIGTSVVQTLRRLREKDHKF